MLAKDYPGSAGCILGRRITFESEDLFGLGSQQKTLLGLRSEYEFWSGDGRVGSTMIYNNERSSERRVRVGTEPKRTVIWNFDLRARRASPLAIVES